MKSLKSFIFEEYNTYRVKNLEVTYLVNPDDDNIVFKVPEIYSEDDFQIYLQDMYLKELPGSEDYAKDFFGINSDKIYDVLFEYDKYEKSDESTANFVEFDINYDNKTKDQNLVFVTLEGLRYIIKFDEFDIKAENIEDTEKTLIDIFKRCETSKENNWPLDIKLDEKNLKYK